jgi:uncharacterized protein YuzE
MRADYDSQADALSIELIEGVHWDATDVIDDTYCRVELKDGRPASIELLNPADHLELLAEVGDRHALDADELEAVARAAIALPDRVVVLDVHAPA